MISPQFEMPLAVAHKAYIYALTDPRTAEIRYVGKSSKPFKRWRDHFMPSVLTRYKVPRTEWLSELIAEGLEPGIVVLECVPEDEWEAAEIKWIAHFRSSGVRLTNVQNGGTGQSKHYKPRKSSIEKTTAHLRGRPCSPETRAKIAAAQRGRRQTPYSRQRCQEGIRRFWDTIDPKAKTAHLKALHDGAERHRQANQKGIRGISWMPSRERWQVYINVDGKRISLGKVADIEEAKEMRAAAERKYFGKELQTVHNSTP